METVSGTKKREEMTKTTYDQSRCSFSWHTTWASHFLGPPLCSSQFRHWAARRLSLLIVSSLQPPPCRCWFLFLLRHQLTPHPCRFPFPCRCRLPSLSIPSCHGSALAGGRLLSSFPSPHDFPPSSSSWFLYGRRRNASYRHGFVVSFYPGGGLEVWGWWLAKMNHEKCRGSRFVTQLGLPLHGSPLVFLPPRFLHLRELRPCWRSPHPSTEGRGSEPVGYARLGGKGGVKNEGGGGGIRAISTVMRLMLVWNSARPPR